MTAPRPIELLSPAKTADIAIDAVRHGADAVYIGADRFGARAAAGNSIADISRAVEFAHRFNARVYATVNTVLFDSELKAAEKLIRDLYRIGVDALIAQDMGILRLDIPPIALHASTQCDTRTVEKAKFLEAAGFSQIVLARELTAAEIEAIHRGVSVPLECFVHGALCVSYSGKCHASCAFRGRSANRGECAQLCRLPYDMIDGEGNTVVKQKHLLSLRDFNQSDRLLELLEAGATSLKIEGRLKDCSYVKNVTAYYSQALNRICESHPEKYRRQSIGSSAPAFAPDLQKSFNRGFTHYFFDERKPDAKMASLDTPKSIGEYMGEVASAKGNRITLATGAAISNGDGLVYFDGSRTLRGFRANKVEGKTVCPLEPVPIKPGTPVYRNHDKAFSDMLERADSADRRIPVDFSLWKSADGIAATISVDNGPHATVNTPLAMTVANTDQTEARVRVMGKLGNTPFSLNSLDAGDTSGVFIPNSVLADIRRRCATALERTIRISHRPGYRRQEDRSARYTASRLGYAENVANRKAAEFFTEHGAESIEMAMEQSGEAKSGDTVMTTRYCIRRELGCCLATPAASKLPKDLTLVAGDIRLSVEFDCRNCQMTLRKG